MGSDEPCQIRRHPAVSKVQQVGHVTVRRKIVDAAHEVTLLSYQVVRKPNKIGLGVVHGGIGGLVTAGHTVDVAATALGVADVSHAACRVEALPVELTNLTTEDLARVHFGTAVDAPSAIVKIARSPVHSPVWPLIPAHQHEQALLDLPWRAEADMYRSNVAALLPAGLRMPAIYAVEELDDDRIAVWMEDVADTGLEWRPDDYRAAARRLGRLAGRLPATSVPSDVPVSPRDFRSYFFGRVQFGVLPVLRDDATWAHPLISAAVDDGLRKDLERCVETIPPLLDQLDGLPKSLAHGDACPQNLLRPADEPQTFVAIDWTFAGLCAVGLDAGQLLAGGAEAGDLEPEGLPHLLEIIVAAYLDGLADEDATFDPDEVRFGVLANLVIRSTFTALPTELLAATETDHGDLFRKRAGYARFLVDLARTLERFAAA